MHRFGDTQKFVGVANREKWKTISISVGVKQEDRDLLRSIAASHFRVDYICIDIAQGHSVLMKEMIEYIRSLIFKSVWSDYIDDSLAIRDGVAAPGRAFASIPLEYVPKIIAGNVCTPEAVRDLTSWGADCVKCGTAGGFACATKTQTGFHVPMFSCIMSCANEGGPARYDLIDGDVCGYQEATVPIISDGSIRNNGDIAKAIRAGATLSMCGSLYSACLDAPGETIKRFEIQGYKDQVGGDGCVREFTERQPVYKKVLYKRYYGSASKAQKGNGANHIEGFETFLPCNGMTFAEKQIEIKESLQSAISYAGGTDLSALKSVGWVSTK